MKAILYGGNDENIEEYIAMYAAVNRDLNLSAYDRVSLVRKLFRGKALHYYNIHVLNLSQTLENAFQRT